MEVERKWLFNDMEACNILITRDEFIYDQAYVSVSPEFRIRRKKRIHDMKYTYLLCIKSKGALERIEIEKELSKLEFEQLMQVGDIKEQEFIKKHFYILSIGKYELSTGVVDLHTDNEFIYGEIEFPTVEEAQAFIPPDWFGREVTNEAEYKMANYWKKTRLGTKGVVAEGINNQLTTEEVKYLRKIREAELQKERNIAMEDHDWYGM